MHGESNLDYNNEHGKAKDPFYASIGKSVKNPYEFEDGYKSPDYAGKSGKNPYELEDGNKSPGYAAIGPKSEYDTSFDVNTVPKESEKITVDLEVEGEGEQLSNPIRRGLSLNQFNPEDDDKDKTFKKDLLKGGDK